MKKAGTGQSRLIAIAVFTSIFSLIGCSDSSTETGDGSTSNSLAESFDGNPENISNLFRDQMDFDIQDVRDGSTNCSDIIERENVPALILKWPEQLKSYLSEILAKFPAPQQINASVYGIYLVPNSAMFDATTNSSSAGLACDRRSDHKGLIFLNYNSVIQKRSRLGIDAWQNTKSTTYSFITVTEGDAAAVTLIHEIFHAIDNKLFQHGSTDDLGRRYAFQSQSWIGNTPKYARGSILSLDDTEDKDSPRRRCKHSQRDAFGLLSGKEEAETLGQELKDLQEKTNFIVPYTMASPAEDFAETLTVYYFGTYYRSWQKRTVSFEKVPIFVHDTEQILKTKQQHKTKTCSAAVLIFGNCKL